MTKVKIDDNEYELDSLSDKAKAIAAHLQAVNFEIDRLQAQTAIYHTARAAYVRSLKEDIEAISTEPKTLPAAKAAPAVNAAPAAAAKRKRGSKAKAH
ncbi:DUF6447 family protein [Sphingorhabdus wooponensis]|uniref:DUF6447 family protein n=1 Tax=Sphingorhabdus wooponensis TaxID=940136 RepID=UPI00163A622A|nr:DUF6447 family protein [Sphingorhabdus wooponensis]